MKDEIAKVNSDQLTRMQQAKIGDIYFYEHGPKFYRVTKFTKSKYHKGVMVAHLACTQDGITWKEDDDTCEVSDLEHYYIKLHLEEGESIQDAIRTLKDDLVAALLAPEDVDEDETEDESESTALVPTGGKKLYEDVAASLMRRKARAEIVAKLAEAKMSKVRGVAYALQKKLGKVMRVLMILEVYLGVHEEIFQVTQGVPAPMDEPISIRQTILYMDEEAAIVEIYNTKHGIKFEGDINWQNVEVFDNWISEPQNLQAVLPELKSIVAIRPSRQARYEDQESFSKAFNKEADSMIYLLIRNGDNLYRVWTSIKMGPTLFPKTSEGQKIEQLFQSGSSWDKEEAEDRQSVWIRNALLIQGLIDRTDVFQPLPYDRIELTKPETFQPGGPVRMIRDSENIITDGHESFTDWRKRLNSNIQRGTRIYFPGLPWEKGGYAERFSKEQHYYPHIPQPGIYTVEEVIDRSYPYKHIRLKILYLPEDTVYQTRGEWDPHDRKRRYSFTLFPDEVINYDDLEVGEIDYFLKSRHERKNYRELFMVLIGLRQSRLEELERERAFVELLAQKHNLSQAVLFDLVEWWKRKVINKRPLDEDSDKAWRMILRRARGEENSNLA